MYSVEEKKTVHNASKQTRQIYVHSLPRYNNIQRMKFYVMIINGRVFILHCVVPA